ncbi:hypothetical protein ACGFJ7_19905 [Actinoplanes sp. NPDC048988]|uniref:hypothetical protein n=1 Tax=Actinoplanes sp. NPDC048988 TaxID=3363901 RepID=UPI0037167228
MLIRDTHLRIVGQGTNGVTFSVGPGRYVVTVALPGDHLVEEVVDVGRDETREVALREAVNTADADLEDRAPLVSARHGERPAGWQRARMLTHAGPALLSPARPATFGPVTESGRRRRAEVGPGDQGQSFLEVSDGVTSVALGLPSEGACLIEEDLDRGELMLSAFPADRNARLALRYLQANDLERGGLLFSAGLRRTRPRRISSRRSAASGEVLIGCYLTLRRGYFAEVDDLIERLRGDSAWTTDVAIIEAETAAARGRHSAAADHLLQAAGQGLPRYTAGFSILVSRMRQYAREGAVRDSLTDRQRGLLDGLAEAYRELIPYADLTCPTTTFRNLPHLRPQ